MFNHIFDSLERKNKSSIKQCKLTLERSKRGSYNQYLRNGNKTGKVNQEDN